MIAKDHYPWVGNRGKYTMYKRKRWLQRAAQSRWVAWEMAVCMGSEGGDAEDPVVEAFGSSLEASSSAEAKEGGGSTGLRWKKRKKWLSQLAE